jgi:hypothetical protein
MSGLAFVGLQTKPSGCKRANGAPPVVIYECFDRAVRRRPVRLVPKGSQTVTLGEPIEWASLDHQLPTKNKKNPFLHARSVSGSHNADSHKSNCMDALRWHYRATVVLNREHV